MRHYSSLAHNPPACPYTLASIGPHLPKHNLSSSNSGTFGFTTGRTPTVALKYCEPYLISGCCIRLRPPPLSLCVKNSAFNPGSMLFLLLSR